MSAFSGFKAVYLLLHHIIFGLSYVKAAELQAKLLSICPNPPFPSILMYFKDLFSIFIIECDREEGMGDRGEDMQQMTTGRLQTRVTAVRTEPIERVLPGATQPFPLHPHVHVKCIHGFRRRR